MGIDLLKNLASHYGSTLTHKAWVMAFLTGFAGRLLIRGLLHDWTKLLPDEASGFVRTIHLLRKTTYGTPAYKALLDRIRPQIELHYRRWKHHPEHHQEGIQGMSLIDLVEMYLDWKAAAKRHADGDLIRSINLNQKRFGYSDDLKKILLNESWCSRWG
jgi:hypothetical protein